MAQSPLAWRIQAVVFGSDAPLPADLLPIPAVSLGRLQGDEALEAACNYADVVVVPSLEHNLANVALEAIACGAPVAAFDLCGMPDIVTDGWNGRLVLRVDPEGLGRALVEMLSDVQGLQKMRWNSRQHAENKVSATSFL